MIAQWTVLARLAVMTLVCGMGVYGADAAQAQDCSNEAALKSASQGPPVELSFRNPSSETRRLYWMDQNGNRKFISLIRPSSIYIQPTAATHSWVVTDDHEKCLNAVTATAEPQTIDVGGQTATRSVTPPSVGTQESIAAVQPPDAPPASNTEPVQIAEPVQNNEPIQNTEPTQNAASLLNTAPSSDQSADATSISQDAAQEDVSVQVPQVSPIEQFGLNGTIRVLAVAEEGKSLNSQATGTVEVVRVNPEWDSGQWSFEPVADTPFVRIKNNWKRTYLMDVNGQLKAVGAPTDADPSHWSIEPVDGTAYVQLRNRESDRFLLNVNGVPNLTNDYPQDQERQSYWQLNPARDTVAVTAPRMQALSAYNSAITDCRDIGGVWTGSSCRSNYAAMGYAVAQPLACRRGWFWDQESGECLYEVASGGAACPPWQQGPGGQCVSNLTCRGGHLRNSRRGASCDCPFGMAPWGNYPNLSCKPSVARIVPLLLMSKFGGSLNTKHGDKRFTLGQAYGNKQFGKNQQTNINNGNGLIIKVSKPVNTPTNLGTNTKPVLTNPVVSTPIVVNPNGPKPNVNNTNVSNTNINNPGGNNPGGNKPVGTLTNPTNTTTTTNTNIGTKPTTPATNPTTAEKKEADILTKALNGSPSEKANAVAFCNANPNSAGCKIALPSTGNVANTSPNTKPGTGNTSGAPNTNSNPGLDKAVSDFNKLSPQQKASTLNACQNNNSPGCTAIKQSAGLPTGPKANTSGNTGINPNLPINPNNRPGNTSATTTNTNTTNNTGTQNNQPNNQGRPGTTTTTTTTTTSNNNPSQNTNPSDAGNNNAIQRACQANPNLPICRGQQNTNTGRVVPNGTNPNLPPNNQQVQNDAKAKADAEAKARADAAAKQNADAAKLKADADARARADAAAKQNADAANRAKVEADNKAKLEAASRSKIEADNRAKADAANKAKADAVAKQNADAKAKADAAAKQNADAAARNKAAADAAARNKAAADAKARADAAAANQARLNAANQARLNAANQARLNAANQARVNAANQARANNARQQTGGCPPGRRRLPNGTCG